MARTRSGLLSFLSTSVAQPPRSPLHGMISNLTVVVPLNSSIQHNVSHGYRRGTIDKTLFIKKDKNDIMLVQVYVDDIIFGSTKRSWCDEFEALMKSRFQMSSMGELTFFLGLQVKQKEDGIFISQDKYVAEILKKFDFASVKTASTPIETQKPLVKDEEASDVDVHLYRSMIGSLMYLTASRPDIMFAVCACSRVSLFDLEAYSDSDYAGANLDRKSTTGEAEYVAAANCCGQVLWIQNQMLDYGFNFMNTKIYIDNESTICIVKNPVYHSKTKHIAIRHHFIRDAYEKKLIQVLKIHTDDNVADLLTKAFDVSSVQCAEAFLTISDEFQEVNWVFKSHWEEIKTTTMAVLESCPKQSNMVAYLEKNDGNAEFHKIIDFLTRSSFIMLLKDDGCSFRKTISKHQPYTPHLIATSEVPLVPQLARSLHYTSGSNTVEHRLTPSLDLSPFYYHFLILFQKVLVGILEVLDPSQGNITLKRTDQKAQRKAKTVVSEHHKAWMKSVSLKQRLARKRSSKKQWVHRESVSKQWRKFDKGKPSVHKDPLFDEIPEDFIWSIWKLRMLQDEGEDKEMQKDSTDEQNKGTDEQSKGTDDHTEEGSATQTTQTPTSTIFGDDETIAQVLLNMSQANAVLERRKKPLPKIDLKETKGRKKIEEEDESESESDGIPEAEKKFKQLSVMREMARKVQEEWGNRNFKHSDLKNKNFEEIQTMYEKIKRSDEDFISIGSAKDERLIKKMNEKGFDSLKNEVVKEEDKEEEDNGEENIVIARLNKVSSPDGDYLVIYRANGNFRAFNYLMEVLHIFDRQDLFHLYDLIRDQFSEVTLDGFELILWGDLKIMMESSTEGNEQSDFWSGQQDWKIVTWRRYPLSKDLLQRMLDLGLEVERESSVALDLIRFIKQQIDEE
ncbi:putative ribonuclease H-like domain-containing protein [Tanacetum coccineum]|uniref:Ribonuclease H-like domain-containing protein n=1 Tax=Tanacetum coccineum TaxID=301880 RepID=A0ABQ5CQ81_9ASTR